MQYFLMRDGAQRCLELLDTYDAVGVDWKEPQPGETFTHHFSGNWWCDLAWHICFQEQKYALWMHL